MQNPFYKPPTGPQSNTAPSPPSYSTRPTPTPPTSAGESAQYSSLSDLTKNRPKPPPRPASGFSYTPDPSRQGYAANAANAPSEAGDGDGDGDGDGGNGGHGGYAPAGGDGRRMPPPPGNYGAGIPAEPPRRNVYSSPAPVTQTGTTQQAPTGQASYFPASAQGYANTASSYAQAGVGKARDGIDSMFTQQRREQVTSNLGKAAAGGAKLLGQGAWKLGKFAANPSGK